MKNITRYIRTFLSFVLLSALASCSSSWKMCEGYFNIISGSKISHVSAKSDSVTIKMRDTAWTIDGITFIDSTKRLTLDNQSDFKNGEIRLFENDTCYVQRLDGNTIFIKMKENKTKLSRTISVTLFSGVCGIGIKVVQAAE